MVAKALRGYQLHPQRLMPVGGETQLVDIIASQEPGEELDNQILDQDIDPDQMLTVQEENSLVEVRSCYPIFSNYTTRVNDIDV